MEQLARRRFADPHTVDESLVFTTEKLEAQNWKRLRAYQGKSSLKTYLTRLVLRLFEDFARRKYGRLRPPEWLSAQGSLWVEVFKLLCHERMTRFDAIGHLTDTAPGRRSAEVIEEVMDAIQARLPHCGKAHAGEDPTEPDDLDKSYSEAGAARAQTPESLVAALERVSILESLATLFGTETEQNAAASSDAGGFELRLLKAIDQLKLKTEERLLLKMVFQDGLSVSDAGRLLAWTPDKAHGKLRRLTAGIRRAFDKAGLTEMLQDLVAG